MKLSEVTPLVLTLNEEANIGRTLDRLTWADLVVVLDSGSTDRTIEIIDAYPNVRRLLRPFDLHSIQWNYGLQACGIKSEWVLALDADYVLSEELVDELRNLIPTPEVAGYWLSFRYCIHGKPLWGSLYPPVVALYRRKCGSYVQDGHTQRLRAAGPLGRLRSPIFHDDRKPLSGWLKSQERYAELEARKMCATKFIDLGWPDRVRKLIAFAPWISLLYCLFVQGCVFQGRHGLYYALQRTLAELVLSLKLIEKTLSARD